MLLNSVAALTMWPYFTYLKTVSNNFQFVLHLYDSLSARCASFNKDNKVRANSVFAYFHSNSYLWKLWNSKTGQHFSVTHIYVLRREFIHWIRVRWILNGRDWFGTTLDIITWRGSLTFRALSYLANKALVQ